MFNLCRDYDEELIIKTAEHTKGQGQWEINNLKDCFHLQGTVCLLSEIPQKQYTCSMVHQYTTVYKTMSL